MGSIELFWEEQSRWSQATFGLDSERGPAGPIKHLKKEIEEVTQSLNRVAVLNGVWYPSFEYEHLKEEMADLLFLVFDAARRSGMTLDDLSDSAFRKLEKNKKRTWNKPVDGQPCEHVRGEHD